MPEVDASVIIPVFNRAGMILSAVTSAIEAARRSQVEVVVVDDASTDETAATVASLEDPRVRLVRMERNSGQSAARNQGLEIARGTFVKFLDSDDLLLPNCLDEEVDALSAGADIVVSGWCHELPGRERTCFDAPVFTAVVDDILAGRAVPTSAALYRRRPDWRWDPSLRKLDDWDFFCQAALSVRQVLTLRCRSYVMRHHGGPRATQVAMLTNAREHHQILLKLEERLSREGLLTEARRRRLAQFFYKELRVLCLADPDAFEIGVQHIESLDAAFQPREEEQQLLMRMLVRALGIRGAIRFHSAVKRALRPARD